MISGIYQIRNTVNGKYYIGRSINCNRRWKNHRSSLRKGNHCNSKLQNAWNFYTEENFHFEVVWEDVQENLVELEGFLLEELFDTGCLYNLHKSSDGGMKGMKMSEDSKKKAHDSRKESVSWREHQAWMKTPEAITARCSKAACPEARKKALETRVANGHSLVPESWKEINKVKVDRARANLFDALDWAMETLSSRDDALRKFNSSWGSLKKFQAEWEEIHGPLTLPKRASGERNGKVKLSNKSKENKCHT